MKQLVEGVTSDTAIDRRHSVIAGLRMRIQGSCTYPNDCQKECRKLDETGEYRDSQGRWRTRHPLGRHLTMLSHLSVFPATSSTVVPIRLTFDALHARYWRSRVFYTGKLITWT